jgi:hypothetical protein
MKISVGQKVGVWINIFENFKMLRFGEALVVTNKPSIVKMLHEDKLLSRS